MTSPEGEDFITERTARLDLTVLVLIHALTNESHILPQSWHISPVSSARGPRVVNHFVLYPCFLLARRSLRNSPPPNLAKSISSMFRPFFTHFQSALSHPLSISVQSRLPQYT
jgi:hypothetical protein